eukprot:COSAG02_NODE_49719_length_325_cov_0.681416_1_plen_61_part_10
MVIGDRRRRLAAAKAEVEQRKVERQEAIRALHISFFVLHSSEHHLVLALFFSRLSRGLVG